MLSQGVGGTDGKPPHGKPRRLPPHPAEQERRKEWGRRWGKLVSESVAEAMKGLD